MSEGPVSSRRFSRRAVRRMFLGLAVAVAVLILIYAGWHVYVAGQNSALEEERQQQEAVARSYAAQFAEAFGELQQQLSDYAGSERIRALFAQGDKRELAAEAQDAAARFAAALKVRLLLPGHYQLDTDDLPPLGFGSLDLLKRAETTAGLIAAEVHLLNTPGEHIVLVERVKNQADQLIGIIHLSLKVDLIPDLLAGMKPDQGYIEIRQSSTGKPLILASTGDPRFKTGQPVTVSIPGSRWTMACWAGNGEGTWATMNETGSAVLLVGTGAAFLVLAGLAGFYFVRRKNLTGDRERKNPEVEYGGAVRAIMNGEHPGMEKLVVNLPDKTPPGNTPGRISRGMDGDDITFILNQDELFAGLKNANGGPDLVLSDRVSPPQSADKLTETPPEQPVGGEKPVEIPEGIFRKYDIRGVVGETLTPEIVQLIGQAIGSEAKEAGDQPVIVGRDGRLSSPDLSESLIKGLQSAGENVIDIGVVPTPLLYFATHHFETGNGVMLTGSHNGPEYNGLKIVLGGNTLSEEGIHKLYDRITADRLVSGAGSLESAEIIAEYIRRVTDDIPVALGNAFKLVLDCGNGVAGSVAPQLFKALGHDVIELYCDLDGRFPNHHPDPSQPENMQAIIEKVKETKADLGFAFDGDGDRLGVVDGAGRIIWPDRQMMAFARDILSRNPGAEIIYDVKCSRHLGRVIEESGGKPLMWKTGHSLIKSKMKEVNAPLAGEMSGHIFFKERWYGFDDALYAGARLLEILVNEKVRPDEFFAALPGGTSTPEMKIDLPESGHKAFMQKLGQKMQFEGAELITVDGYRAEFKDGWGLIRPSNTTPCLVVRFEADSQEALDRIQTLFREQLRSIKPDLQIPF